jgi:hypothetical protein
VATPQGPAPGLPPGPGRCKAGAGAFPDDGALKFRQRPKEMKDQRATGRAGVDGFGQRAQADLAAVQRLDRVEQLPQGPRQPVELPDHQRIIGPHIVEGGLQLRPVALGAAGFLRIDACAARRLEGIELQGEILLLG